MVRGRGTWDGGHEARNRATHAGYSRKPQQWEQWAKCMSGWGGTGRGTKDSTFFPGLSRGSSLEGNVCGLPTTFRHFEK
jgi:hypothetical protein